MAFLSRFPLFSGTRRSDQPMGGLFTLLCLLGAPMLVSGIAVGAHRVHLVATSEATVGRIVDIRHEPGGKEAPIVSYEVGGRRHYHQGEPASATYSIGDELAVRYDPAEPKEATVVTFMGTWMLPLTLTLAGVVFLAVALGMWRRRVPGVVGE